MLPGSRAFQEIISCWCAVVAHGLGRRRGRCEEGRDSRQGRALVALPFIAAQAPPTRAACRPARTSGSYSVSQGCSIIVAAPGQGSERSAGCLEPGGVRAWCPWLYHLRRRPVQRGAELAGRGLCPADRGQQQGGTSEEHSRCGLAAAERYLFTRCASCISHTSREKQRQAALTGRRCRSSRVPRASNTREKNGCSTARDLRSGIRTSPQPRLHPLGGPVRCAERTPLLAAPPRASFPPRHGHALPPLPAAAHPREREAAAAVGGGGGAARWLGGRAPAPPPRPPGGGVQPRRPVRAHLRPALRQTGGCQPAPGRGRDAGAFPPPSLPRLHPLLSHSPAPISSSATGCWAARWTWWS